MKALLVNPNRYRRPPVPPLGLEYIASALAKTSHICRIADLCFEDDPLATLEHELVTFRPQMAGVTIRNIDTVICENNEFFLDDIREVVTCLKSHGIPVVLGGAGFSFIPQGILDYTGADCGVMGPGERAFISILDVADEKKFPSGQILDGWSYGFDKTTTFQPSPEIPLERYTADGGLIGFETQKGCTESCAYCGESGRQVVFKTPAVVVDEIACRVDSGFTGFHLCDTEFNQDLDYCKHFLDELIARSLSIHWVPYLKTYPYDDTLFRLLKRSGVSMATVSVPTGERSMEHAGHLIRQANQNGLKIAVDYLCGFPGQRLDDIKRDLDSFRAMQPDTVGLNSTYRLYPSCALTQNIRTDEKLHSHVFGVTENNPEYILPVFYRHITPDMLFEAADNDPLFTVEGFQKSANYERISGSDS